MLPIASSKTAFFHTSHPIIPSYRDELSKTLSELEKIKKELNPQIRCKYSGEENRGPYSNLVDKLSSYDNYFKCEDTAAAMNCALPAIQDLYKNMKSLYEELEIALPSYQSSTSIVTNVRSSVEGVIKEKVAVTILNMLIPCLSKIESDVDTTDIEDDLSKIIINNLKKSGHLHCLGISYKIKNEAQLQQEIEGYMKDLSSKDSYNSYGYYSFVNN